VLSLPFAQKPTLRSPARRKGERDAPSHGAARRSPALVAFTLTLLASSVALGAPKKGQWLETNVLSSTLVSRDFTARTTTSVADAVNLAAAVGLHYYFADALRLGMSIQYTERLWPEPPSDSSRFQRFAFMPQLGWNFLDPFFVSTLFTYAPRTRGKAIPDMAISAVLGAALPVTRRVHFSVSAEVPYAFYYHDVVSLVVLTGLSVRL
jgi:hypothetical protein